MNKERIHRVRKNNNFVLLDKGFLNNPNLSLKAKGLLAYVLSLPDDWVIYTEEITKHHKDGKAAVLTAFKELENEGHIKRERIRESNGQLKGYKTTVYETPITENRLSEVGKTDIGKTDIGKSSTTNNDLTKNNLTKNNTTKTTTNPFANDSNSYDESRQVVVDFYQSHYGNIPPLVIKAVEIYLQQEIEGSLIIKAIQIAIERGKKWDYAAGILNNLRDEHGIKTLEQYEARQKQDKQMKKGGAPSTFKPTFD
ncbi:MAG: DnaD domain protein [Exiguobacterium sp.]|uniref:DnaD domain protein n=1 Tax=Exiguobacterium sp. s155 TaxID=2751286 RepID=UPI001BEC9F9E|nr:DnaD domain protein [Exiguobacterium sp. s155]MBR2075929.1 DnaD domain protein [Exiguobacterium sp.]MBR3062234.1 DnaD domain protein [Exiguobacterium sp.]MBR3218043.1 DnaD domain protein [Exiguobacterium sp.]